MRGKRCGNRHRENDMAESERYKWAVEQHRAISELAERMAARGGILAKLGCVFQEYAERIMRENLRNSERMHYQHTRSKP